MRIPASVMLAAWLLTGCTATVDQSSLLPSIAEPAPVAAPTPPDGYARDDRLLALPSLGVVHVARLFRRGNNATVIYSGGNGSFVSRAGSRLNRLAALTGADIVAYDYPGRGGTTVPASVDALIALGPALAAALRQAGWIGSGPVYSYGFSFGGAPAANIAQAAGVAGLVLEATAADIPAVARNAVPGVLKPFVRIAVADDLKRYDYAGYAVAAKVPILLLTGRDDRTVDLATVRRFADQLKAAGADTSLAVTPGGHGAALTSSEGETALKAFLLRARN